MHLSESPFTSEKQEYIPVFNFDRIYQAAKEENREELQLILKNNACIDEFSVGGLFTPASKLASEGKSKAAEFLISQGANLYYVVEGAAYGKHYKFVNYLCKFYGAPLVAAAIGAARNGHFDYVEKVREVLLANEMTPGELTSSDALIANAAAMSGYMDYAEKLFKRHQANANFTTGIVAAAIRGGYFESISRLNQDPSCIKPWVLGSNAVMGGFLNYAEKILIENSKKAFLIDHLALAAAQAGHIEFCERLRVMGANVNWIAEGAMKGGRSAYAQYLYKIHSADIRSIWYGAKTQLSYMETLWNESKLQPQYDIDDWLDPKLTLSKLSHINSADFRDALVRDITANYKNLPYDLKSLSDIACKLVQLRKEKQMSYPLALSFFTNEIKEIVSDHSRQHNLKKIMNKYRCSEDFAKSWSASDIQNWFLWGRALLSSGTTNDTPNGQKRPGLPLEIYLYLSLYLGVPSRINPLDLYLHTYKIFLLNDIRRYSNAIGRESPWLERAEKLKKDIQKASTFKQIADQLKAEKSPPSIEETFDSERPLKKLKNECQEAYTYLIEENSSRLARF